MSWAIVQRQGKDNAGHVTHGLSQPCARVEAFRELPVVGEAFVMPLGPPGLVVKSTEFVDRSRGVDGEKPSDLLVSAIGGTYCGLDDELDVGERDGIRPEPPN